MVQSIRFITYNQYTERRNYSKASSNQPTVQVYPPIMPLYSSAHIRAPLLSPLLPIESPVIHLCSYTCVAPSPITPHRKLLIICSTWPIEQRRNKTTEASINIKSPQLPHVHLLHILALTVIQTSHSSRYVIPHRAFNYTLRCSNQSPRR